MTIINQKQFGAVLSLSAKERYEHFVKRVADSEEVWGLKSELGWTLAGDDGKTAFPLWPHKQYAEVCATDSWADSIPEAITLEDLIALLKQLESDGLAVAVFPTPQGKGVVVSPNELHQHLKAELENYL